MKAIKRILYKRGDQVYHATVFSPSAMNPMYTIICNDPESGYHGATQRWTMAEADDVLACILKDAVLEEVAS